MLGNKIYSSRVEVRSKRSSLSLERYNTIKLLRRTWNIGQAMNFE